MHTILTISDIYLPGFRGGGPIRSLSNLVDWLGEEFRFKVLTPDRDHGDSEPYGSVTHSAWQPVGTAEVMYLTPGELTLFRWGRLIGALDYDLLYLNSFFSPLTVRTLLLRRASKLPQTPVILAPRGEFSPGALSLKRSKKRLYIHAAKRLGLLEGIIWQASSSFEVEQIERSLLRAETEAGSRIVVAPNLPPRHPPNAIQRDRIAKEADAVRLVFLSRIVPKKNLKGALELLLGMSGTIVFDIYGPIEDGPYWRECQAIIRQLAPNITVSYLGEVNPDDVVATFARYHAFFFPTLGENFGHVILEALSAGCLVLTSDETPWRHLAARKTGWDFPLAEPECFLRALEELIMMDNRTYQAYSQRASEFAREAIRDPSRVQAHRELFLQPLTLARSVKTDRTDQN